jgi:hypothetical protein
MINNPGAQMKTLFKYLEGTKLNKEFLLQQIRCQQYTTIGDKKITHCQITALNGFTFTGEAACVDPANYNKDKGEDIAFDNAFDKMWVCYGFALQQYLYEQA